MDGSEIMAMFRDAAMICINLALPRKRYKYIQRISFGDFSAHSQVLDSISYTSLQLANQSAKQACLLHIARASFLYATVCRITALLAYLSFLRTTT